MGGHSLDGECSSVVSKSVPLLICVSPYHWDLGQFKTAIFSTRSISNKTCLLIRTGCLPFNSTEVAFLGQTVILTTAFCFGQ